MPTVQGDQSGGIQILSYRLQSSPDNSTWTTLTGQTEPYESTAFVWTDLTTTDEWYFRYQVVNEVGASQYSVSMLTYVGTKPAQMVAPKVEFDIDPKQILISW